MREIALVSFLRAEHVKKLRELNYRIISNIVHVIITRLKSKNSGIALLELNTIGICKILQWFILLRVQPVK